MRSKAYIITLFTLFWVAVSASAQTDSIPPKRQRKYKDSSIVVADTSLSKGPKPGMVALRSAIIPGLGQITNKQIWKVPIIYGGLGALAYMYKFNHDLYIEQRNLYRIDSSASALQGREYYRRNRDLSLIIGVGVYAANILDAYVYAHLRDFDVSDDLSMTAKPVFFSNIAKPEPMLGLGIVLKLK